MNLSCESTATMRRSVGVNALFIIVFCGCFLSFYSIDTLTKRILYVKISEPDFVTTIVCSKCALGLPSALL
jgi:hypothetical protein